jgi:hypothetical protein
MDPGTRIQLKACIRQEVETMLTEGDRVYLQGLSPSALLEAVENELCFLGLYAHEDHETPVVIHRILEEHLDAWCQLYLWSPKVEIDASPFIQESQSEAVKILFGDETLYFDFGQTTGPLRFETMSAPRWTELDPYESDHAVS